MMMVVVGRCPFGVSSSMVAYRYAVVRMIQRDATPCDSETDGCSESAGLAESVWESLSLLEMRAARWIELENQSQPISATTTSPSPRQQLLGQATMRSSQ